MKQNIDAVALDAARKIDAISHDQTGGATQRMALIQCEVRTAIENVLMNFVPVESSNIAAIGYDAIYSVLFVRFKTGAIHSYDGVPPSKHAALMGDGKPGHSVGSAFAALIKDRYPSTKIIPG